MFDNTNQTVLILLALLPMTAALAVALLGWLAGPATRAVAIAVAAAVTLAEATLAGWLIWQMTQVQAIYRWDDWVRAGLGLDWALTLLPANAPIVGLLALAGLLAVFADASGPRRYSPSHYALLLAMQSALMTATLANDLLLMFLSAELAMVPLYLLHVHQVGRRSTPGRVLGARLFLGNLAGSGLILLAILGLAVEHFRQAGTISFAAGDLLTLDTTPEFQKAFMAAMLAGLAMKASMLALEENLRRSMSVLSSGAAILLGAGLVRFGLFGIYRVAIPAFPSAAGEWATVIAGLATIVASFAAIRCCLQTKLKPAIGCLVVMHAGVAVTGMFTLRESGLGGAILYMTATGAATAGAIAALAALGQAGSAPVKALSGLGRLRPVRAGVLALLLIACTGVPPLASVSGLCDIVTACWRTGAEGETLWQVYAGALSTATLLTTLWALLVVARILLGRPSVKDVTVPMLKRVACALGSVVFTLRSPARLLRWIVRALVSVGHALGTPGWMLRLGLRLLRFATWALLTFSLAGLIVLATYTGPVRAVLDVVAQRTISSMSLREVIVSVVRPPEPGAMPAILWLPLAVMVIGSILATLGRQVDSVLGGLACSAIALACVGAVAGGEASVQLAYFSNGWISCAFQAAATLAAIALAWIAVRHVRSLGPRAIQVEELLGLAAWRPGLSAAIALGLASMIGLPLTAGFFGRVMLLGVTTSRGWHLASAVVTAGMVFMAVGAVRIVGRMYSTPRAETALPLGYSPLSGRLVMTLLATLIVILGFLPQLLMIPLMAIFH